jgi:2-keto-4-pentenoate hydratase
MKVTSEVDFESPVTVIALLVAPALTNPVNTIDVGVAVELVRPVTVGVPVKSPSGNVIVTVSDAINAMEGVIVTVNVPVAPLAEGAQTAVPATVADPGTHFFESLSHVVPISQHPGP